MTFVDGVLRVVHPVRMQIRLGRVRLEIVFGGRVVMVVSIACLPESTTVVAASRN